MKGTKKWLLLGKRILMVKRWNKHSENYDIFTLYVNKNDYFEVKRIYEKFGYTVIL